MPLQSLNNYTQNISIVNAAEIEKIIERQPCKINIKFIHLGNPTFSKNPTIFS